MYVYIIHNKLNIKQITELDRNPESPFRFHFGYIQRASPSWSGPDMSLCLEIQNSGGIALPTVQVYERRDITAIKVETETLYHGGSNGTKTLLLDTSVQNKSSTVAAAT